jgi:hypothetical protein
MTPAKFGIIFVFLLAGINDNSGHDLTSVNNNGGECIDGVLDTSEVHSSTELIRY